VTKGQIVSYGTLLFWGYWYATSCSQSTYSIEGTVTLNAGPTSSTSTFAPGTPANTEFAGAVTGIGFVWSYSSVVLNIATPSLTAAVVFILCFIATYD